MKYLELVIAAAFTVMGYSLIYRENKLYRFAEHTFIGAQAGWGIVFFWRNIYSFGIERIIAGRYYYIIPIILGCLIFTLMSKKYAWMSRWGMSIIIGTGTGLAMRGAVEAQILSQIKSSMIPIFGGGITPVDNLLVLIGIITVIMYFFYTGSGLEKPPLSYVNRVGRLMLMATFGASYGGTVLTRMGVFSDRVEALLIPPAIYVAVFFIIIIAISAYYDRKGIEIL